MTGDESVCRVPIPMLAPTLGEHVLLLRLQHRELADFGEVTGETGFCGQDRQSCSAGHGKGPSIGSGPRQRRTWRSFALSKPKSPRSFQRWDISNAGAAYTKDYVLGKDSVPSRCRDAP